MDGWMDRSMEGGTDEEIKANHAEIRCRSGGWGNRAEKKKLSRGWLIN